jgi:hypothetical protein
MLLDDNYRLGEYRLRDVGIRRWRQEREYGKYHVSAQRLCAAKPVAKSRLGPGVVVWARVPFVDIEGWKTRPAVVKTVQGRLVSLAPGSSSASRWRFPNEFIEVTNLADSGLRRPTGFRRRDVTVDVVEVVDIVGSLADPDLEALLGQGNSNSGRRGDTA